MGSMVNTIAMVLQILSALGVILLVLLQHGKGADMGAAFGSGDYVLGRGMRLGASRPNLYPGIDLEPLAKSDPDARAFLFWSRTPFVERLPSGEWRLGDARFASRVGSQFSVVLPASTCDPG